MLDNKEVISESALPLTPEEKQLLELDLVELNASIMVLRSTIKEAYGVESFSDIAGEVLRFIEKDPYHRLSVTVYGPSGDLSSKAICDKGLFGVKMSKEIN